jgi:hypothetical protein
MNWWQRITAICVGMLALAAVPDRQVVFAQDAVEERRPRVELGVGAWISTGETKWAHNASSIPGLGNPTSKLTYKDVGTNIIDLTGKVWFTPRLFGRLNLGIGNVGGGRLTDDDYGSGQRLFSETNSDIDGVSTWYLNADFGGKVKEFANHRGYLEVFGGYQYWYTKYNAVGLSQVACDPTAIPGLGCPPLGPVSNVAPRQSVITNTANWHSIRVGGTTEYRITRRFSLQGTVAFIPVSIIDNKDVHRLRTTGNAALQQDPSISMFGYGIGADADVGARLMIVKNFYANVGYRVWWNYAIDGHATFHSANAPSSEFPLTQFQSLRHGLTFGLNYSF